MQKAELFIAYDRKRVALEADRKRIAEGQTPPDNYEELVAAVDAAYEEWQAAPD